MNWSNYLCTLPRPALLPLTYPYISGVCDRSTMAYCCEFLHRLWMICLAAHEVEPQIRREILILSDLAESVAYFLADCKINELIPGWHWLLTHP